MSCLKKTGLFREHPDHEGISNMSIPDCKCHCMDCLYDNHCLSFSCLNGKEGNDNKPLVILKDRRRRKRKGVN